MQKKNQGFTLIELMIVIAIIGILAAIAIPQYQNYVARSQVTRVVGELSAMKTSIEEELTRTAADKVNTTATNHGYTTSNLLSGVKMTAALTSITVEGTLGTNASSLISGKTVTLTRTNATNTWACASTADAKYRPAGC